MAGEQAAQLTKMVAGLFPYDDGSGFRLEVKLTDGGGVMLSQGDHMVMVERDHWNTVNRAVCALFDTADEVARIGKARP